MTHIIYSIAFLISLWGCILTKIHANCASRTITLGEKLRFSYSKNRILDILLIALPPIILLSLRYGIGADYYNYEFFYGEYLKYGYSQFEPLAEALIFINNHFFGNYQCFLAILSIATFLLMVIWCVKFSNTDNLAFSVSIMYCFYFGHASNTLFQSLAASIVLFAFYFAQRKKFIKFVMIVLLAALIHSSALIVVPLYFIIDRKIDTYENGYNVKSILKIIGILLFSILVVYIFIRYGSLYGVAYSGYIGKYSEGGMMNVYLKLGILLYIPELFFMPNLLKESKRYEFYYILIVLESVSFIMTITIAYAFRMAYYFSFAHAVVIPAIIENCVSARSKIMVKAYFAIALLFWFIFTTYVCKYNGIYEYKTVFGI